MAPPSISVKSPQKFVETDGNTTVSSTTLSDTPQRRHQTNEVVKELTHALDMIPKNPPIGGSSAKRDVIDPTATVVYNITCSENVHA